MIANEDQAGSISKLGEVAWAPVEWLCVSEVKTVQGGDVM